MSVETVEAMNLKKYFGPVKAVDGISFLVKKGDVLGFLGPNGAGKTTTMRMLSGFIGPDSGTAKICSFDIKENPYKAKEKIGYIPENNPLYTDMTVFSFLNFIAQIRGFENRADRREMIGKAAETASVADVLKRKIEALSKGYKSRVSLAQALIHNPDVLILDEPTEGLDPNQKQDVRNLIRKIAKDKIIIISTHILEEVEEVCSRVIIINKGKIVTDSTPEILKKKSPSGRLYDVFRSLT